LLSTTTNSSQPHLNLKSCYSILANDEKLKDPTDVANAFNNFFITVTEKISVQQIEKLYAILILKDSFPGNFASIKIIPINEAEI
jgi:hypothetical protein